MKLSKYNILIKKENNYLLINTKTGYIVELSGEEERKKFDEIENGCLDLDESDNFLSKLSQMGFVIQNLSTEIKAVKEKIDSYFISDKLSLTLIVTENCNFGCKYCYEKHNDKSFDKGLYNSIYNNIRNGILEGKYKKIEITFFGGEPMLQFNNIIVFLKKLNKLLEKYPQVSLSCSMVTNGYLLTLPRYKELANLGIKNYQITLDGIKDTHNKYRPLLNGGPTWEKILENLVNISEADIKSRIYLRSNINYDISQEYISFLYDIQEKLDNDFVLQLSPIKKFNEHVIISNKEKNINTILNDIYSKSSEMGIKTIVKHDLDFGSMICKVALPNSYVIDPYRNLSKCTVYFKNSDTQVGKILKDGSLSFNNNLNLWNQNVDDKCSNSKIFPLCANRNCPYAKINNLDYEICNQSEKINSLLGSIERGLIQ